MQCHEQRFHIISKNNTNDDDSNSNYHETIAMEKKALLPYLILSIIQK